MDVCQCRKVALCCILKFHQRGSWLPYDRKLLKRSYQSHALQPANICKSNYLLKIAYLFWLKSWPLALYNVWKVVQVFGTQKSGLDNIMILFAARSLCDTICVAKHQKLFKTSAKVIFFTLLVFRLFANRISQKVTDTSWWPIAKLNQLHFGGHLDLNVVTSYLDLGFFALAGNLFVIEISGYNHSVSWWRLDRMAVAKVYFFDCSFYIMSSLYVDRFTITDTWSSLK